MLVVEVEKKLGEFSLNALFASEGGATVLFGPSGAGKTSIINMIAGLLKPDRGRIVLNDEVMFDDAARIDMPAWRCASVMYFRMAGCFLTCRYGAISIMGAGWAALPLTLRLLPMRSNC